MDFFAHQDRARRQTRRMLLLFALAVAAIIAAVDLVLLFALGVDSARGADGRIAWGGLFGVSAFVALIIGLGSLYRIASLGGGGAVVARQLGAVPVPAEGGNVVYRRLRNVVEEIAIASGVPVPQIFVLEEEAGINAFASGYAPTDAAITITRGALDKLTRAELQGVVGHEFSHILNGDMRLNIRLMGAVFGLLVVSTIGRKIAEGVGRRDRSGGGVVMFGLALLAVGYIGVVFARVIKASISRQREFLADASAVQFTRQTEGIAGALKKIGGLAEGSKLAGADAEEVAHMLFGDGVGYSAAFATHPPLAERIRRLDPGFSTDEFKAIAAAWSQPVRLDEGAERVDASIGGFAPMAAGAPADISTGLPLRDAEIRLTPAGVAGQVGNPGSDDRAAARCLHATLPERLRTATRQPEEAMPLVFALLLNDERDVRARQLALVAGRCGEPVRALTEALAAGLDGVHPMLRLPLASLAFPTLRRRPRPQLTVFMIALRELIEADGRVTLDEYCLAKLIRVQVIDALDPAAVRIAGRVRLPDVETELKDLLAIVARHGHEDATRARRAYALGLHEVLPGAAATYAPPADWIGALDRALAPLDRLAPAGKELVVRALVRAIGADGGVVVAEAELLRAICAALHCPLPPLLQDTADSDPARR